MTDDEISEYVERIRGRMAAAEAYAAENPSRRLDGAKKCLEIAESSPEPKTPIAYMMWAEMRDNARRYYHDVLLQHYTGCKIERPIDTAPPTCEDG